MANVSCPLGVSKNTGGSSNLIFLRLYAGIFVLVLLLTDVESGYYGLSFMRTCLYLCRILYLVM